MPACAHPQHPGTLILAGQAGAPATPSCPSTRPGRGWYSSLCPDRNVLCVRSGSGPGRQSRTLFIHPAPAPLHPAFPGSLAGLGEPRTLPAIPPLLASSWGLFPFVPEEK